MGRFFTVLVLLAPPIMVAQTAIALDLDSDIYRNPHIGLRLVLPDRWVLSRQTGYPSLLAVLSAVDAPPARISLAKTTLPPGAPLKRIVQQNANAMRAIGLQVTRIGEIERFGQQLWRIVAQAQVRKQPKQEIRQLYLRTPHYVLLITLSCPAHRIRQLLPDLDYVLESLEFSPPAR